MTMAEILKILGLCLLGVVLVTYLQQGSREFALLLLLALVTAAVCSMLTPLREVREMGAALFAMTGLSSPLLTALFKVTAIAVVVRIGAALCRDASQSALSVSLELGGTLCALEAAVPLLESVLELMEGWL